MISNTESNVGGKPAKKARQQFEATADFQEMVNLLAVFSEATNQLAELETSVNAEVLEMIDDHKSDYAKLQEALTKAETALEILARKHPEWFAQKKSIKTPYGTAKLHKGTRLEVTNDEATVKLLRAEQARVLAESEGYTKFNAEDYIRISEVPKLEALETLDDSTLAKFMVRRVTEDKFSVTPAKLDMGKAVAEAAQKEN